MKSFHASSSQHLLGTLEENLFPMPPRRERKPNHTEDLTEKWVACHFLMGITRSDLLEYPLCVEPGDRPDLVLSSRSGKIGIEITEAVSQVGLRVDAHAEDEGISVDRFVPPYRVNEERSGEEYIISFMLIGFTHETLPVKIFNSLRYGYTPIMAVVSTFFVLLTVGVLCVVARFGDLPRLFGAWDSEDT